MKTFASYVLAFVLGVFATRCATQFVIPQVQKQANRWLYFPNETIPERAQRVADYLNEHQNRAGTVKWGVVWMYDPSWIPAPPKAPWMKEAPKKPPQPVLPQGNIAESMGGWR